MFDVRHIAFAYGRKPVLRDISFDVAPGEILAVIGANGAGKTTLMKILAGVMMQDRGAITLDGVDSVATPVRYRTGLGYLPEHVPVYDEMCVSAYLTYRAQLKGERSMRIRRRVRDVLEQCGLIDKAEAPIRGLSQGYRKRVGFAEAMLLHPRLLLLDDVLAGLDVPQRKRIASVFSTLSAHAALIVTGHEIADMITWATRFLVLENGRVAAEYSTHAYNSDDLARLLECHLVYPEGADA